jgi:hypothetical protein
MNEFLQAVREAGFSLKQIEFFEEWVAQREHSHTAEEIIGLEETVAELVEEEDGEEGKE